ncbi:MAG TPA: electron transfer flavoprotein subunit alpha [Spirochaetia bacterium]|nr:electron transfer flavoprotein subunit alpha [Spirochaetia bacterium]
MKTNPDHSLYNNVWVLGETTDGHIADVTLELIGIGRALADKKKSRLACVFCLENRNLVPAELSGSSADIIIVAENDDFKNFCEEEMSQAVHCLIREFRPEIFLSGATSRGRALAPRIAVLAETGLTADCTGLDIDLNSGLLFQTRPAFGGNLIATIKTENARPQMATVRPGVFIKPADVKKTEKEIIIRQFRSACGQGKIIISRSEISAADNRLKDAHFIIAGGRGVKNKEGFDLLKKLADTVGGAVGATRAAVDLGWIPCSHQIGQTGHTVRPRVYIACGISGQVQHIAGIQGASLIIAINKDPEAPLMKMADLACTGDLYDILPELIEKIKNCR